MAQAVQKANALGRFAGDMADLCGPCQALIQMHAQMSMQFGHIGVPFMSEARLVVGVALFECAFRCSKVVHAIVAPCRFHGGLVYDLRRQAIP